MAKARKPKTARKPIEQYEHKDKKRLNNPPVGLVDAHTDNGGAKKKKYEYDPHIDPQLQWAGKAEHTSFEVPTVSLHVHERIDPRKIIDGVKKLEEQPQLSLFDAEKKPLREAIEFYKHKENWSNRLIAGDSLLVMNSLLEKEGMGGKVQMVYFDPPYGIKYGSNFQPFVNKRDVKDGKDEDLTAEPEMIKAFRDTWELDIHSYLTYLRDRVLLARDLLHESGSIFVQISDENVHHVRELLDEVFGRSNYVTMIAVKRPTMAKSIIRNSFIYLLWYAKNKECIKSHKLYNERIQEDMPGFEKKSLGMEHKKTKESKEVTKEIRDNIKIYYDEWDFYQLDNLVAIGEGNSSSKESFEFNGKTFKPGNGKSWKTDLNGLKKLVNESRLEARGDTLCYKNYFRDYPVVEISNLWDDTAGPNKEVIYVVQTKDIIIERCLLMTSDPGDLILDITCGSGTTAYVSEQWGRRWITCDTSRVATTLAKQRLMTASFDYYKLAHPEEGISSGFKYNCVPHITLGSIANNEPVKEEILYDRPFRDSKFNRITGPFTVEAVPAPMAKSFDEIQQEYAVDGEADNSVARTGETLRQSEWRDELLKTGVRGKGGNYIQFTRVEPLSGTRYLQCEAETNEDKPKRVLVCFGPEHAPLEQRMVELAIEEAGHLKPKAELILFCAFQFDEEAAKDIDEMQWAGVTLLKVQMNADMLTDDLKKKRSSNDSFWLIGQPDVVLKPSEEKGKQIVEVLGFDYYNPKTGAVDSGGKADIAMWMLDTDYDGRSLLPTQVFFPMAGAKDGWAKLAKNLKAEIDEDKIEAFRGTVSLPFKPGAAVAVKIIDARGIESLKIIRP